MDGGIIIPDKRPQKKLHAPIASPNYAALHNPRYAVLSSPDWSVFQSCSEHALAVVMASIYNTSNKPRIKANIAAHFRAQPIPLNNSKRILAALANPALTTRDHGSIVTTSTFSTIALHAIAPIGQTHLSH